MKRVLKWIGIILGGLLALVIVLAVVLHFVGQSRLANAPGVTVQTVSIPDDAEAVARGEHLATAVTGCAGCHGQDLGGTAFIDEAPIGYIPAPNLTPGEGGVGGFDAEQWARAMRHGIGGDGRTLAVMPSHQYAHMSDEDLGALLAYLQTAPAVDSDLEERAIAFPGTIIFGVFAYNTLPVNVIDHETVGGAAPPAGATAEYGEYLSYLATCRDCHGANLAGGTDPNAPVGPNVTPGGDLADWTEGDFITAMRTGVTPSGHELSEEMPWRGYANMTDAELQALWLYLQSLPALESNDAG